MFFFECNTFSTGKSYKQKFWDFIRDEKDGVMLRQKLEINLFVWHTSLTSVVLTVKKFTQDLT